MVNQDGANMPVQNGPLPLRRSRSEDPISATKRCRSIEDLHSRASWIEPAKARDFGEIAAFVPSLEEALALD